MSGVFPTSPKPKDSKIVSDQPTFTTFSTSGRRQSVISGGHLWRAKMNYPVMERSSFAPIFAFCAKQRGESFSINVDPHHSARGTISGTARALGPQSAGTTTLIIDGVGSVDTFLADDFFAFTTHSKVYMVTEDVTAITGIMVVKITPPLIESVGDNEVLLYNNFNFKMAFDGDPQELKVSQPNHASYSVDLVESIT